MASRATQMVEPKRGSRWRLVALLAFVVMAFATIVWIRSRPARPPVSILEPSVVPLDYHIVYRSTAGNAVTTEDLSVHRPFEASDTITDSSGATISSVTTRLGRQRIQAAGADPTVLEVAAAAASADTRLDAVAGDAAAHHALTMAGTDTFVGRQCHVVRTRAPLASTALDMRPTKAEHTDTCVDDAGLVLAERVVSHGKLVRQKVATKVDATPAPTNRFATTGTHLPRARGGGVTVTVSDDSRPPGIAFWQGARPPAGFTHLARLAVALPTPPTPPAGSQNVSPVITAIDDVYIRGGDVVVVEQGETLAGEHVPISTGTRVDLGPLGSGQLVRSGLANSVTAQPLNRTSYVRVTGTLRPAALIRIAASLTKLPPGTLTTVPNATADGSS